MAAQILPEELVKNAQEIIDSISAVVKRLGASVSDEERDRLKKEAIEKSFPSIKNAIESFINKLSTLEVSGAQEINRQKLIDYFRNQLKFFDEYYAATYNHPELLSGLNVKLDIKIIDHLDRVMQGLWFCQRIISAPLPQNLIHHLETFINEDNLFEANKNLKQAIDSNDSKRIFELLRKNNYAAMEFSYNIQGQSPLVYAVNNNKLDAVREMLQLGALDDRYPNLNYGMYQVGNQGITLNENLLNKTELQALINKTPIERMMLQLDPEIFKDKNCFAIFPAKIRKAEPLKDNETPYGIDNAELEALKKQYSQEYHMIFPDPDHALSEPVLLFPKNKPVNHYYNALHAQNNFARVKKQISWEATARTTRQAQTIYARNQKEIAVGDSNVTVLDLSRNTKDFSFIVHTADVENFLNNQFIGHKREGMYLSCSLMSKSAGKMFGSPDFAVVLDVPSDAIVLTSPQDLGSPFGSNLWTKFKYATRAVHITHKYDSQEAEFMAEVLANEGGATRDLSDTMDRKVQQDLMTKHIEKSRMWQSKVERARSNVVKGTEFTSRRLLGGYFLSDHRFYTTQELDKMTSGYNELIVLGDKMVSPLLQNQDRFKIRGILMYKNKFNDLKETEKGRAQLLRIKAMAEAQGWPIILVPMHTPKLQSIYDVSIFQSVLPERFKDSDYALGDTLDKHGNTILHYVLSDLVQNLKTNAPLNENDRLKIMTQLEVIERVLYVCPDIALEQNPANKNALTNLLNQIVVVDEQGNILKDASERQFMMKFRDAIRQSTPEEAKALVGRLRSTWNALYDQIGNILRIQQNEEIEQSLASENRARAAQANLETTQVVENKGLVEGAASAEGRALLFSPHRTDQTSLQQLAERQHPATTQKPGEPKGPEGSERPKEPESLSEEGPDAAPIEPDAAPKTQTTSPDDDDKPDAAPGH